MGEDAIRLEGPVHVELPDGSIVGIRPGPYGKGLAVVPTGQTWKRDQDSSGSSHVGPGRPPRKGTAALRERLAKDQAKGKVRDAQHYFRWIRNQDPSIQENVARQIVYRELRSLGDTK